MNTSSYQRLTLGELTTIKRRSESKVQRTGAEEILLNITPSYKLRAKKDVVHNFLGQGYVRHGGTGSLKVIHQVLVARAHLGYCQGDGAP